MARTPIEPAFQSKHATLYRGDCLEILPTLERESIDAIIADPPYCSGAATTSGVSQDPAKKYCHGGKTLGRPSFHNDTKDPSSFKYWLTLLGTLAKPTLVPGAYVMLFTDWRQDHNTSDVLQAAGYIKRGKIAWNKGQSARAPHKGYFRHQCEYIIWGSNGPLPKASHDGPFAGCYSFPVLQKDKHHMTGKPTPLMRELVRPVKPGGVVMDIFMGSGTTGVAAIQMGRKFIGMEMSDEYFDIAVDRIKQAEEDFKNKTHIKPRRLPGIHVTPMDKVLDYAAV